MRKSYADYRTPLFMCYKNHALTIWTEHPQNRHTQDESGTTGHGQNEGESSTLSLLAGIDNDIANVILSCKSCQNTLPPNPREPMVTRPLPKRAFKELAGDFCTHAGQQYLVLVDCFSGWPDIPMWNNNGTQPNCPPFSEHLSVIQDCLTRFGLARDHSSLRKHSRILQTNGVLDTPHPLPRTHRATAKQRLLSSQWKSWPEQHGIAGILAKINLPKPVSEHSFKKDRLLPAQALRVVPITYKTLVWFLNCLAAPYKTLPAHRRAFSVKWQCSTMEQQALSTREITEESYNQYACPLPGITIDSKWPFRTITLNAGTYMAQCLT